MKNPSQARSTSLPPARGTRLARYLPRAAALLLAACTGESDSNSNDLEILSSPATEAVQGEPYSYALQTSLHAGPPAYFLEQAPAGMTVSAAGLVRWTPSYADLGTHMVRVLVSNPNQSARQSFSLRVSQGALFGTTLSQRGHVSLSTPQDYVDYYSGHAPYGEVIAFHGSWRDDLASAGQIPSLALVGLGTAATYGFTPSIGIGWTDGAGNPELDGQTIATNSWFNSETRGEFIGMVTDLVTNHTVPYLFLGNETNAYWLTHTQAEWDEWIDVFEEAYLAIKTASPQTMVFTTFQLERMKGLGAGTTGWTDPPHFQLLADHVGMIDAIGFTSYPYFEYATPGAIPAPYYDEISAHWTGPVIFTETGWLSSSEGPYPGGVGDQGAFPATLFDRTRNLDLEYVTWLFLHDYEAPATIVGFGSIGLRSNDGLTVRPLEANWQAEVALRERR